MRGDEGGSGLVEQARRAGKASITIQAHKSGVKHFARSFFLCRVVCRWLLGLFHLFVLLVQQRWANLFLVTLSTDNMNQFGTGEFDLGIAAELVKLLEVNAWHFRGSFQVSHYSIEPA